MTTLTPDNLLSVPLEEIINGITELGVYVTDLDRRIVFWNKAAEAITGYTPEEVVGKRCLDGVLCHIDRHGRKLCDSAFCPLFNSMRSDSPRTVPQFVFALKKNQTRVPMMVSVSPVKNREGKVIGGLELFRDGTFEYQQLRLAQAVQTKMMPSPSAFEGKWPAAYAWSPADMIGGDLVIVFPHREGKLLGLVIDVSGHGTAPALVTGFIWKIMSEVKGSQMAPLEVIRFLARSYEQLEINSHYFVAQCFEFDPATQEVTICGCGYPQPFFIKSNGESGTLSVEGDLIGLFPNPEFQEIKIDISDKRLFFTSDGIVDCKAPGEEETLGTEGLIQWCQAESSQPLEKLPPLLIRKALDYASTTEPEDDLTILVLEGNRFKGG